MTHTISDTIDLNDLPFDNRFTRELPADPETANHRRQVMQACYSRVQPARVAKPELVAYAHEVAELLDIPGTLVESEPFVNALAGNDLLPGMDPYAVCYGGHQFGNWAGQLGDGRAINLGELVNRRGERWALQLKGAGPTPYSRTADGLAVLRSSVREFLCSRSCETCFTMAIPNWSSGQSSVGSPPHLHASAVFKFSRHGEKKRCCDN
jgi:uncharacterized protein YdiU (UPF0061 family)